MYFQHFKNEYKTFKRPAMTEEITDFATEKNWEVTFSTLPC